VRMPRSRVPGTCLAPAIASPFALSPSKGLSSYGRREVKGFDRLSPNGQGEARGDMHFLAKKYVSPQAPKAGKRQ